MVFCIKANSFPGGVHEAHKKLLQLIPSKDGRIFYGISYPENGKIIYKASTTEIYLDEGQKYNCETFTIRKGLFLGQTIINWKQDEIRVKTTFDELLSDPRIDINGYCLEEYVGDNDMKCMVPLDASVVMLHDREELQKEFERNYAALTTTLSLFTDVQLNSVPFKGSWSAGQVARHIIKATGGIPDKHTQEVSRAYDAHGMAIKSTFLNFFIKMQSPEFVIPENRSYRVKKLLADIDKIRKTHLESIAQKDLHALCLDFELPPFGQLTRYEWLKFISYHTQRHIRQVRNIHKALDAGVDQH